MWAMLELLLGLRLYVLVAVAILFGAPIAVHLVSMIGHPDGAAPVEQPAPAVADRVPDDRSPLPPVPPPPQEASEPNAPIDAAPALDPRGITPQGMAVQPSDDPAFQQPAMTGVPAEASGPDVSPEDSGEVLPPPPNAVPASRHY